MNRTAMEETGETVPLKPLERPKHYLPVVEVGRTFGTTYFLMYDDYLLNQKEEILFLVQHYLRRLFRYLN